MTNQDIDILEKDGGENEELVNKLSDEELKKPLLTEIARKKHFREKFEKEKEARLKLEEETKKLKEELAAKTAQTPPAKEETLSVGDLLELGKKGLADVEKALVVEEAKKLGVPVSKFIESSLFPAWLDKSRAEAKVGQATPRSSQAVSVSVGDKKWNDLTPKERDTNISQAWEQAMRRDKKDNE